MVGLVEIFALIAYVLIGALAGIASGLLGVSGGIVTVPSLAFVFYLLDFPQGYLMHSVIGTSLAAMVLTGISSTWSYQRHQSVMWNIVWGMLPGIVIGSLLGAWVAHLLSGIILEVFFGGFIFLLGLYLLIHKSTKIKTKKLNSIWYALYGFCIAFIASLIGIGGGIFIVTLLIHQGFIEKKALGTSAAGSVFITFLGSLGFFYFGLGSVPVRESLGYIYLPAFFLIGVTAMCFAPLGVKWVHQISAVILRKIFAGVLLIVGLGMIFF